MEGPVTLLESCSPVCPVQAVVEQSGACVYFYLFFDPAVYRPRLKACWVCNTAPAPDGLDRAAMDRGEAPRMPRSGCLHDPGGIRLDPEALSVQWLEEGDGAALMENGRILALIPGWAGQDFPGYARYAKGTTPLAWALGEAEAVLAPRVARSAAYWRAMEGDYWPALQEAFLSSLEHFFGKYEKYYSIDGGSFPPKALVTGRRAGVRYAFTVGVSALCQPQVEQYFQGGLEEAAAHRRIELCLAAGEELPEPLWDAMLRYLSAQSALPWSAVSWLGHGHTVPCRGIPGLEAFPAVVLADARELPGVPAPAFPPVMGEPVAPLWAAPITGEEYDLARSAGSEALLRRAPMDRGGAPVPGLGLSFLLGTGARDGSHGRG